jgi:hypothetical protein
MRIGADAMPCRGRAAAASAALNERLGWARIRMCARNELELQAVSEIAKVVEGRLIDIDGAAKEVNLRSYSRVQAAALRLGAIAPLGSAQAYSRPCAALVAAQHYRSAPIAVRRRSADKSTKSLSGRLSLPMAHSPYCASWHRLGCR